MFVRLAPFRAAIAARCHHDCRVSGLAFWAGGRAGGRLALGNSRFAPSGHSATSDGGSELRGLAIERREDAHRRWNGRRNAGHRRDGEGCAPSGRPGALECGRRARAGRGRSGQCDGEVQRMPSACRRTIECDRGMEEMRESIKMTTKSSSENSWQCQWK
jgi:hypothetical protein